MILILRIKRLRGAKSTAFYEKYEVPQSEGKTLLFNAYVEFILFV